MTEKITNNGDRCIEDHPMYSASDLAYFRAKGYSDAEILAFWDRDHAAGVKPVIHRRLPRRYDAGKGRKVTGPGNDEADLFDAIREQLSPHAVAAIASCLQTSRTNNPDVDRQVDWFAEQLRELVGGDEQQTRLAEELGL